MKLKNIFSRIKQGLWSAHVDTKKVPDDLKSGFNIKTLKGMKYYLPSDLPKKLSKVLGVEITVDTSVDSKDLSTFRANRSFDATIMATSMSYKVITEALNLQYLSENPPLIDPTGKIKELMNVYQEKEKLVEEYKVIEKILFQMVQDSECIPLFYFSSPFFVKTEALDISVSNLEESVKFYKMVVK